MIEKLSVILIVAVFLLSGCKPDNSPTEIAHTTEEMILPTNTVVAQTETALHTATIEPSPTPEVPIFREDFSGSISPLLSWKNEQADRWSLTEDGFLQIIGSRDIHIKTGTQKNMLCTQLPQGDFAVTTHIVTDPAENFQQAAIFVYQDANNFVSINRGFCDLQVCLTGGNGFYMDFNINGDWGSSAAAASSTDVYLKLERVGSMLSGYYASNPNEWQLLRQLKDTFDLKEVCLGAGNGATVNSSIIAQFDYLDISKPSQN